MRIAYDHQIFSAQRYGGVSRYFVQLASAISRAKHSVEIVAPVYLNHHLRQSEARHLVRCGAYVDRDFSRKTALMGRANALLSPLAWMRVRADIVHETYYSAHGFGKGRRRVLTVYDMIHELYSEEFPTDDQTTARKRAAVERADHIICISHSTRDDLERLLGVPRERTTVIHLSHTPFTQMLGPSPCRNAPYLLYVGPRRGYKNFTSLVHAYAESSLLRGACEIVAFGGGPFQDHEMELLRSCGVESKVQHATGDDVALARHYRDALAFVYPSMYEGFGIPPLEAMDQDCPVVCSNASSIPEVVGNGALLFDPTSVTDLIAALERVVSDDELRADLRLRGKNRLQTFSWARCAQETAAVYQSTLA